MPIRTLGGQLATIDRLEVNDFLFKEYTKTPPRAAWIGVKRFNGKWCYPNGKPVLFHRWHSGEPNNSGGNENFVVMLSNGYWNDVSHDTPMSSVCEITGIV